MSILSPQASDVYISEVNFSQTLSQVANAVASQIVVASQGRVGPIFWTDPTSYLSSYGNPNAAVSFDHYQALDYFREGNGLWANRVVEANARYSAVVVHATTAGITAVSPISGGLSQSELTLPNWSTYVASGETAMYVVFAGNGPGSYANNTAITVQANNLAAPTGLIGSSSSTGGSIGSGTFTYAVSAVSASGSETLVSAPATVIISSAPTTNLISLTWTPVVGAVAYNVYGRTSPLSAMGLLYTVGASTPGWVDDGLNVPSLRAPLTNPAQVVLSDGFTLSVFDLLVSNSTPVETFQCTLSDGIDFSGQPTETTQRVNPYSAYVQVISRIPALVSIPVLTSVPAKTSLAGGTSGSAPTLSTINAGWGVFLNKQKYTIDTMMNGGRATPSVQNKMDSVAQTRAECVAFLDTPSSQQTSNASVDYRNVTLNLNSSYSAIFTPDLLETDPTSGKFLYIPPSGMMCGLFARTTNLRQPWFSIAGLNRGLLNVLDVRYTYNEGEMTHMFGSQVNYMRKFQGQGIALWEQNTLASQSSALRFLNVRTLCNIIKRSAYSFLLYGLQDPLDDILKLALVSGLEEYLKLVQAGRGISSYQVISNKSNNPDLLANSGILAIAIIIVPILAVQKIQLVLGISKQGLTISESTIASLSA